MSEALSMWVIYDHPTDYPHNWVVREWRVAALGRCAVPRPMDCAALADSLTEARLFIPPGRLRMERFPDDDPKIAEVWI